MSAFSVWKSVNKRKADDDDSDDAEKPAKKVLPTVREPENVEYNLYKSLADGLALYAQMYLTTGPRPSTSELFIPPQPEKFELLKLPDLPLMNILKYLNEDTLLSVKRTNMQLFEFVKKHRSHLAASTIRVMRVTETSQTERHGNFRCFAVTAEFKEVQNSRDQPYRHFFKGWNPEQPGILEEIMNISKNCKVLEMVFNGGADLVDTNLERLTPLIRKKKVAADCLTLKGFLANTDNYKMALKVAPLLKVTELKLVEPNSINMETVFTEEFFILMPSLKALSISVTSTGQDSTLGPPLDIFTSSISMFPPLLNLEAAFVMPSIIVVEAVRAWYDRKIDIIKWKVSLHSSQTSGCATIVGLDIALPFNPLRDNAIEFNRDLTGCCWSDRLYIKQNTSPRSCVFDSRFVEEWTITDSLANAY